MQARWSAAAVVLAGAISGCGRTAPLPCAVVEDEAARAEWVGRWVETTLVLLETDRVVCLGANGHPSESRCYVLAGCESRAGLKRVRLLSRHASASYDPTSLGIDVVTRFETPDGERLQPGDYIVVRAPIASDETEEFFIDATADGASERAVPADRDLQMGEYVRRLRALLATMEKTIASLPNAEDGLVEARRVVETRANDLRREYVELHPLREPRVRAATRASFSQATSAPGSDVWLLGHKQAADGPWPARVVDAARRLDASYAAIFAETPGSESAPPKAPK